ncbi:hypothetical protein BH10ACT3_BH10ACT3_19870 [soil metagenome]
MGHEHHHHDVQLCEDSYGQLTAVRETELGHMMPVLFPCRPGQHFVCDSCGRHWVAELWPQPSAGQWQSGVRFRRESWWEQHKRQRFEKRSKPAEPGPERWASKW